VRGVIRATARGDQRQGRAERRYFSA
jgi:hypothetical protein